MSKINVAIADDNQKMVSMMTQLLNLDQEIEVRGSSRGDYQREKAGRCSFGYYHAEA